MKIYVKGFGEVTLTQRNFIARGGEGAVYAKGDTAYKIYEPASKMIPTGKMNELSVLDHPHIIKPDLLILDKKNKPIGHTMRYVKDTFALCQLFTKAFKKRNKITPQMVLQLAQELQKSIEYIHSRNILVVDLNELNFLTDNKFKKIYAIDVNSYQTPSFPATAIMESIRDRHHKKFTENSDWFSWAIISFQLLVGIHPYKGKHPKYEHLPVAERLNARMKDNVSVFHKDATVPMICESFDVIPPALRVWFLSVFESGNRVPPPKNYDSTIKVIPKIKEIAGSNLFDIQELGHYDSEVLNFASSFGTRVVVTENSIYVGGRIYSRPSAENLHIGFAPRFNTPVVAYGENGLLKLYDVVGEKHLTVSSTAEGLMVSDDRIYVKNGDKILEVKFIEPSGQIYASLSSVGKVLDVPGATQVFDGVVIQNLLGKYFASVFPESGKCYQPKLDQLDKHKIIDAKFARNVLMLIAVKSGRYDRFVVRFSNDYQTYDMRQIKDIAYTGLNFAVAEHGICTLVNEEEKIEAFTNRKDDQAVKIIEDKAVDSAMKLFHEGAKILFAKGTKLYSIAMK